MGDAEIDAGIDDVEVEVTQEQEDIDQKNEAEQDGAAYATADYSGDVYVEQSGTLTAGTLIDNGDGTFTPRVTASTLRRWPMPRLRSSKLAVQSNSNSQDLSDHDTAAPTPTVAFTAYATFDDCCTCCGVGDAEIEAGIEDVDVEIEQEQEDIDQKNKAEQDGAASAEAYSGYVDVEQTGELTAAEDGVDATSEADADADLEQKAIQDNDNAKARPRASHLPLADI